jgi:diguanylate cyclase (GGDEF)-like protein
MSLMDWFKGDEESQNVIREGICRLAEEGSINADVELTIKDGTRISIYGSMSAFNVDGKQYYVGTGVDITERIRKQEKILYISNHDQLTGLQNRRFFSEQINLLNTQSQLPLTVIMGDINGLKLTNDAFGHAEGDKLLVTMAKILKECCRAEDIVARVGGDEFSILLPRTDEHGALATVRRIKNACEEHMNKIYKEVYYASISLGYATKHKVEEPFVKIYKEAEEYMYRRKLFEHKSLHNSILSSIKTTMYEKSDETQQHADRIVKMSRKTGQALGLSEKELTKLELSAMLHDIGKVAISNDILRKLDKLTDSEWCEIKKHSEIGFKIAEASPELKHISEYILCHHERWDGKGYPQGLKSEKIPLISRVIALVDSYDAMTEGRIYKSEMTIDEAVIEIKKNAGTQFDPPIARIFVENVLNKSWS